MKRFPGNAKWHEGLTPEELERAAATARIHELSKRDRHAVITFVLWLAATALIAVATASLVRVVPTPDAVRMTAAGLPTERLIPQQ
jgi:hypothetical protein